MSVSSIFHLPLSTAPLSPPLFMGVKWQSAGTPGSLPLSSSHSLPRAFYECTWHYQLVQSKVSNAMAGPWVSFVRQEELFTAGNSRSFLSETLIMPKQRCPG
jgi:hypothetical protein